MNGSGRVVLTCAGCVVTRTVPLTPSGAPRTPRGWKVVPSGALCAACLRDRYAIRALTVPVAGLVDGTWAELGATLQEAWSETTRAANWIATELYARDVRRAPDDKRLRPMPRIYLYPEVRALFPAISPINLTALIQQVEQTYRKRRYELLWQRAISLPTYRYPVPLPIHAQAWRLEETPGGAMLAHCRIGDRWWALRLRGGAHFMRQREALRQLVRGEALPAAGALFARQMSEADAEARGASRGRRVWLKLVAWLPRASAQLGSRAAQVETAASDLLIVRVHGRGVVATVPGDHIRRSIGSYTVRRVRLMQQLGVVRRWLPAERRALQDRLERLTSRHHPALRTWLQQSAAHVARAAQRAGCAVVEYADEERGFCDPFPWQALRLCVQHAVEGRGLRFVYASGVPMATAEGTAREDESLEVST